MWSIQAGRLGAKTVLLERNSQLGGTTTTGGYGPGLYAWGKQVISGIGWELVAKSVEVMVVNFRISPEITGHKLHHVDLMDSCIPPSRGSVPGCGGACLLSISGEGHSDSRGLAGRSTGAGVNYQLRCKQIIDCRNATVVGMLGFERMRGDERQPGIQVEQGAG